MSSSAGSTGSSVAVAAMAEALRLEAMIGVLYVEPGGLYLSDSATYLRALRVV